MSPQSVNETADAVKIDPRIGRTRQHVLTVAREMLTERKEALTFTLLADRALVSRRTLYTHWGTIENLIADTVDISDIAGAGDFENMTVSERAAHFLGRVASQIDPGMAAALTAVIAAAAYESDAKDAYERLDRRLFEMFQETVGASSHDVFIELVSPLVFLTIIGAEISPEIVASLSERAAKLIS